MTGAPWPLRLAASEGVANARTGGWVSLIAVVAVAWTTAAAGLANALEVDALVRAEQEWVEAGAFVMSVEPGSDTSVGGIDVASCEALSSVDGITASFASALTADTVGPVSAPGTATTLGEVSPGVYAFVGVREPSGPGVLSTAVAAGPTGIVDGERTVFEQTDPSGASARWEATAVVVDGAALGPSLAGAFLTPTLLTGDADSCVVRTDAAHLADVTTYVSEALTSQDGSVPVVRPLVAGNSFGLDFATAYSDRILRWAWVGGAVVLAALWALVQRTRRTRMAVYQTFGAHLPARVMLQLSEWAYLSVHGVVWGWAIATAFSIGCGVEPTVALVQVGAQALATWCAASLAVIGIGFVPVGTVLDALKDRS